MHAHPRCPQSPFVGSTEALPSSDILYFRYNNLSDILLVSKEGQVGSGVEQLVRARQALRPRSQQGPFGQRKLRCCCAGWVGSAAGGGQRRGARQEKAQAGEGEEGAAGGRRGGGGAAQAAEGAEAEEAQGPAVRALRAVLRAVLERAQARHTRQ